MQVILHLSQSSGYSTFSLVPDHKKIVDEKFPDKKRLFLDRAVYTKNRQFRMYGSRKFGSYRFFHLPGVDKPGDTPNAEKFWESLVSYFPLEEKTKCALLEIKCEPKARKKIVLPPGTKSAPRKPKAATRKSSLTSGNWLTTELSGIFQDEVYKVQLEEDENQAWLWVKSHDCQISGTHESNHIKYLFDFNTKQYTQKCTSDMCRGRAGPTETIPQCYWPSIEAYLKQQDEISFADIFSNTL